MTTSVSRPGRNISYSLSHRLVWYRVAKTGTRSVTRLLNDNIADYTYLNRSTPLPNELLELLDSDCFRFTVVRNPWDRLVSAWRDKLTGRNTHKKSYLPALQRRYQDSRELATAKQVTEATQSFTAFLKILPDSDLLGNNAHFQPQALILGDAEVDFVARFETFNHDVNQMLETIGFGHLGQSIPHENRSKVSKHYSAYYDDRNRDLVAELFRDDIERWGYKFERSPE